MPTLLAIEALEADRQHVRRQLAELAPDPWGTVRVMWENRLADLNRQIEELAARHSNYASVALIFEGVPVIGSGDIRLDFAAEALDSYQRLISLKLASKIVDDLPDRGKPPGAEKARLFIRDIARGSMGFILEEIKPDQEEAFPTALKEAVEGTTGLLDSISSAAEESFEAILAETQPRIIAAVQKFAKVLHESGATTRIIGDERKLDLSANDIERLSLRLNEVEIAEESAEIEGTLLGILPESRQFELKPPGDEPAIKGAISEELATRYVADTSFRDRLVLRQVRAQVKVTKTVRNGRTVREQRTLEAVDALAGS